MTDSWNGDRLAAVASVPRGGRQTEASTMKRRERMCCSCAATTPKCHRSRSSLSQNARFCMVNVITA